MTTKKILNKWFKNSSEICRKGVWLASRCECGAVYYQHTFCNREDCEVCGKEHSWAHYRRFVRGIKFIKEIYEDKKAVGYLVVTTTKKNNLRSKESLSEFRRYVIRMLKREFENIKGVARWHWAGEKSKCWYPHLNLLINVSFLEKESQLNRLKKLIENKYEVKVVYYCFLRNIWQVIHRWRYISRPTFLLQKEVEYDIIKGMRNIVWFGNFEKKEEEYSEMSGIEFLKYAWNLKKIGYLKDEKEYMNFIAVHKRCVICGRKLKYVFVDVDHQGSFIRDDFWFLGSGFYWVSKKNT